MYSPIAIGEKTFGSDHPKVATRLGNLALLLLDTDRLAEVEPLMRRALAIDEKSYGPEHPKVAGSLYSLARLLKDSNRVAEAEPLMRRALAIDESSYGPDHPMVARDLHNLAALRAQVGDWAQATALLARAKPILIGRDGGPTAGERDDLMMAKLKEYSQPLRRHAIVLHHARARSAAARAEGFELAQWALQTDAAEALAQMSARLAKGEGPLVDLVRERQDLVARRQGEDKRLLAAVGRADAPTAAALRMSIAALDKDLERIDAQLAGKFPEYAELSRSRPLAIARVQALLNSDEALIQFLDVKQLGQLPEETLAWIVTRQTVTWHRIPLGTRALADRVMALRCGLDESPWNDADSADKCVDMVKQHPALGGHPGCGQIVVPDKCPDEEIRIAGATQGVTRSAKGLSAIASYFRDGQANVAEVRKLCPLPDTAHELRCVARSLGAEPSAVVLGKDMTEAAVKTATLSRYRVLHFATHGLLAGEVAQLGQARAEPALVLSPPDQPTEEDDGLLTASEVASLKLDADWVVLSACNTAGGEEAGAEALSGLARAFFYAGARALLVSHWPVDSYAATMLMSRTFAEMRKSGAVGRAEAFRRAMLALMSDDQRPWTAHPAVWAPFVVVGAGAEPPTALSAASKSAKARSAKAAPGGAQDWRKRVFDQQ